MLKVLHVNLHDKKWGEGSEARLLHEALPGYGIESELWVRKSSSKIALLNMKVLRQETAQESDALTSEELMEIFSKSDLSKFDVIHFHLQGKYLSPLLLPFFQIKPVVITVYDCSLYTAGCKHSAHCSQWAEAACTSCPLYVHFPEQLQRQKKVFLLKQRLYQSQTLHLTYYHSWQKEQLLRSVLQKQELACLPHLYDAEAFYPGDRAEARRSLGLAEKGMVLFLHSVNDNALDRRLQRFVSAAFLHLCREGIVTVVYKGEPAYQCNYEGVQVRNLGEDPNPALVGEYYRAADLNLYLAGLDQNYAVVEEAAACALPSLLFRIGAAENVVNDGIDGFLIPQFDQEAFIQRLQQVLHDADFSKLLKENTLRRVLEKGGFHSRLQAYVEYYQLVGGKKAGRRKQATKVQKVNQILPEGLLDSGWEGVAAHVEQRLSSIENKAKKNVFTDTFFYEVFSTVDIRQDKKAIWQAVRLWMQKRTITARMAFSAIEERSAYLKITDRLRTRLTEYFQATKLDVFKDFDIIMHNTIIQLWRFVFLNVNSVIQRDTIAFSCPEDILKEENQTGYPYFFLKSMYFPYVDKEYHIDVRAVIRSGLPLSFKLVLLLWLTTAPMYSGTEFHRKHVLRYIEAISKQMAQDLNILSPDLCVLFIEHFVMTLWRISYLGGNNINTLREYGNFIRENVKFRYPQFCKPLKARRRKKKDAIRIGYISMNFRNQAVSQYMANRLIYHDRSKFHVKTFILKRFSDDMTELLKKNSEEWVEFDNLLDFAAIADTVKKSELDLLIFADIGMDVLTYTLGAMNLAPKQAVLVGHGTTTGLSTLDYYISGDHEPLNAQEHYTERLICLPNAGSAQLPPSQNESEMTREKIGVPEEAVLFISCANGIKHYYNRDELFIEILQKAPNAYIVLKPFQSTDTVDYKFKERIQKKAEAANVADRLIQLPPLPDPGDLMGLIVLADVQLDTYPYGGWTTNLEALYYHLPLVTQVGNMARNRWGFGLLRALGISEGIAGNEREYVDWAVRFAKEPDLRKRVAAVIEEKASQILFNGAAAQSSYEAVLTQIVNGKKNR